MFFKTVFRGALAGAALLVAAAVHAETPSVEQANQALDAMRAGKPDMPKWKIAKVLACFPAFERPQGTWVCPVESEGDDRDPLPMTFSLRNGEWRVLQEDANPACPSLKEAEQAFRTIKNLSSLRVTGSVDDGEGMVFTADRGITRQKRGAYRLMCRYDVKLTATDTDWLYLAYVWRSGDRYVIDDDLEIWDN